MKGRWKVYSGENAPQCTSCGMWAPSAYYRRRNGQGARDLTDYCPNCGAKMTAFDECEGCPESENGSWQDNGICFACREKVWVYGRKHREERKDDREEDPAGILPGGASPFEDV